MGDATMELTTDTQPVNYQAVIPPTSLELAAILRMRCLPSVGN